MTMDQKSAPLIGLCGGIGCGKTSVAEMLVDDFGFVELSFADKLKRTVIDLFQLDPKSCFGTQEEKMAPLPHDLRVNEKFAVFGGPWPERVGKPFCGRWLLEYFGTEACRAVWSSIWVEAVRKEIEEEWEENDMLSHPRTRFVVPDLRFQNEQDMISKMGGITVRVEVEGGTEVQKTGHASDDWYATADVNAVLSAPKPGLVELARKTSALMHQLDIHPRVVRIDSRGGVRD